MKLHGMEQKATGTATFGCMWKEGEISANDLQSTAFCCTNANGQSVPLQSRVTAYWPDRSIKWTAHSADSTLLGDTIEVTHRAMTETERQEQHGSYGFAETTDAYEIEGKDFCAVIKKEGNTLFESIRRGGREVLKNGRPVLQLEEPVQIDGNEGKVTRTYFGLIRKITVEEQGAVQTVFRFEGVHVCTEGERKGDQKIPFIIRMFVGTAAEDIKFQHTFLYDGDEEKDFLKGIGLTFESPLDGALYNRHVKFTGDAGVFHEVSAQLSAWRPRISPKLYERQIAGERITDQIIASEEDAQLQEHIATILENSPNWDTWSMTQDSAQHFKIRKKLRYEDVCMIDCLHGGRTLGGCAFGSEAGSVMIGIRDFWEKYPGGVRISGLSGDTATAQIWFYSPEAESFDFRHYAHRGYNQVCYEGYDYKGADPVGIACTSECAIGFSDAVIPTDEILLTFAENINHPPVYVADP
ncbi:MAG: hypothetical protein K6G23_08310, partial [Lachnospiraceae bacterium]|nr:hypothetical protein [Lachnospiraceae bacterium]